ncbi:hypothetical protein BLS_003733 [Venturia inaequalis]|uniref:Uncharacterized protein n=1 Tax=Venturia inaequalis TaxID=5025 RepID=A0A8H3UM65_VENIN|nr:hypothetical protein BLS_003733 [Venturia inaequalis]
MEPRPHTRSRSTARSASPPAIHTPRPSIWSEKSYSNDWWLKQEREQRERSVGSCHNRSPDLSLDEAERMDSDVETHKDPTLPKSEMPRRGHSLIDATSSDWDRYSAEPSFLADQDSSTTFLESTITIFENDESQSDYGSEQENQPPCGVPASPPHEPTYHRRQRQPLKQLNIDRNGNLLLTPASLAEHSLSSPGRMFAVSSQIDEDEELDSDTESNASTIMLPNTKKRNVGVFEDEEERHHSHVGNHTVSSRHPKRLKTSSGPGRVDSTGSYLNNMHASVNFAPAIALTSTIPSVEGIFEDSDTESTASTIVPSPRNCGTTHRKHEEDRSRRKKLTKMTKIRRASSTSAVASASGSLDTGGSRSPRRRDERRNFSMPAIGRSKNILNVDTFDLFSNQETGTFMRPQRAQNSLFESSRANRDTATPLPGHRVWLPTPAKTSVAGSIQHAVTETETTSVDDVLARLKAAEDRFTHWLTEVRNKKDHYRRLLAQQKEDRRAIEMDLTRLQQLEPIIQTMATKETNEIDESICVHKGDTEKLSAQRKEIRQRLLGFEKLRHDFEEERLSEA